MKELFFFRHGETEFNRQKIVQGSGVDSSLNETGQAQAKQLFDFYKAENFEVVLTSALRRTHQTMKHFIDQGMVWEQWPEINEINWGIHEGKKSAPWMIEAYKELIAEWKKGNFDARLEDGESAAELAARCDKFLAHLPSRKENKILICSHGRTLRCLMSRIKKQHLRTMESYTHSNTGLFKVLLDGENFEVIMENDVQHLALV